MQPYILNFLERLTHDCDSEIHYPLTRLVHLVDIASRL